MKSLPDSYPKLLKEIKSRIQTSRIRASLSANTELIFLYWDIGKLISEKQKKEGWGKSVVERLASDIQKEFPGIKGFSTSNIWRMRRFYISWNKDSENLAQPARETKPTNLAQSAREIPPVLLNLPWFHNVVLTEKIKDSKIRLYYAQKAIENGWSRNVLILQIKSRLHDREGRAITNFKHTLPSPGSDLANQILKDPYVFDFLSLDAEYRERELESQLIRNLEKFLLELGAGFAFVGRQFQLPVADQEYYIDLLFYHLQLRRFVVIDLKIGPFIPEYAGKMNFYLNAVDDTIRHPDDEPSIGLILCQDKNNIIAEYALRGITKPMGVSKYKLTRTLPRKLKSSLPSIKQIEQELMQNLDQEKNHEN